MDVSYILFYNIFIILIQKDLLNHYLAIKVDLSLQQLE